MAFIIEGDRDAEEDAQAERDRREAAAGRRIGQGPKYPDVVRGIGVTLVPYYRWPSEFGGLQLDQVKRTKELEQENALFRKTVSDMTLDRMILAEVPKGNF